MLWGLVEVVLNYLSWSSESREEHPWWHLFAFIGFWLSVTALAVWLAIWGYGRATAWP